MRDPRTGQLRLVASSLELIPAEVLGPVEAVLLLERDARHFHLRFTEQGESFVGYVPLQSEEDLTKAFWALPPMDWRFSLLSSGQAVLVIRPSEKPSTRLAQLRALGKWPKLRWRRIP